MGRRWAGCALVVRRCRPGLSPRRRQRRGQGQTLHGALAAATWGAATRAQFASSISVLPPPGRRRPIGSSASLLSSFELSADLHRSSVRLGSNQHASTGDTEGGGKTLHAEPRTGRIISERQDATAGPDAHTVFSVRTRPSFHTEGNREREGPALALPTQRSRAGSRTKADKPTGAFPATVPFRIRVA